MSKITKWYPGPNLAGDVMPWGDVIMEGTKFLVCSGLTGRDPNKKQEYPEVLSKPDFSVEDQYAMNVCPHNVEDQVILIMEKFKKAFAEAGTSFEHVFLCDYYLVRRFDWPRAWRAMKKWMDKECPDYFKKPRPGVLANVHGLAHPDMLIEIKMWATVPESAGDTSKPIKGSRIAKFFHGPKLGGDVMPWGNAIVEGTKFLVCSGHTGRDPNKKQEYPELLENEDFTTADQAAMNVCPHNVDEQVIIILEKMKKSLERAGTSFENVFYIDYILTRREDWFKVWRTMEKWMNKECPDFFERPRPNVLWIVHGLDHPDMLVEMRIWACIPE